MRIALCQTDIAWEQPAQNLARLEPLVAGVDADVVVLSELFATGFTLDPAPVAEAPGGGRSSRPCAAGPCSTARPSRAASPSPKGAASSTGCISRRPTAGAPARQTPSVRARRRILNYTPGSDRVVVEYRGFRFLLLVCYDLRFPV